MWSLDQRLYNLCYSRDVSLHAKMIENPSSWINFDMSHWRVPYLLQSVSDHQPRKSFLSVNRKSWIPHKWIVHDSPAPTTITRSGCDSMCNNEPSAQPVKNCCKAKMNHWNLNTFVLKLLALCCDSCKCSWNLGVYHWRRKNFTMPSQMKDIQRLSEKNVREIQA